MCTFLIVLILIASILMVLAVLVQNPKSGMASNFGASNQVMGVRQTADFLEKASWTLIAFILVLSILSVGFEKSKKAAAETGSAITEQVQEAFEAEQAAQAVPEFEGAEEPIAE